MDLKQGIIVIDRPMLRPGAKGDGFVFGPLKHDKLRVILPALIVMETLRAHWIEQIEEKLRAGSLWDGGPGYVFRDRLGGHASYWTLITRLKSILQGPGIELRHFNDLRHTCAVTAIRSGDDVKTIQVNLGHHTAAFTPDMYGHVTAELQQDSSARMQAFITALKLG